MRNIIVIAIKDLRLAFRDRAALTLMLAAPFLLTLGLGLITGRFSRSASSGLADVPVILVNQDGGRLGDALVEVFQSKDLADLVEPAVLSNAAEARQSVDDDQTAAAVIIPPGFTDSIFSAENTPAVVPLEVYSNPTRPTGAGVIRAFVEGYLSQVEFGRVNGRVTVEQLIAGGYIRPDQAAAFGAEIGARAADSNAGPTGITLRGSIDTHAAPPFDVLAHMAPGMALMFLMFTVTNGGRTILTEQFGGTLPRLLVTPVRPAQVLAGKAVGIFLTGVLQMLILIGGSSVLFGIHWGDWPAVLVLVLAAVFGALGWGLLLTVIARTPSQVSNAGTALMLIFGILGGSFTNLGNMPDWFRAISRITPNAWALDGFTTLALGHHLSALTEPLAALVSMGLLLFALTTLIFVRRGGFGR